MPLADYAHWNEDAQRMWWEEEGRHAETDARDWENEQLGAADAFAEELAEYDTEQLEALMLDVEYHARWPKAKKLIEWELKHRGHRDG